MTKKKQTLRGFSYYVSDEILEEYRRWPTHKKLEWLYAANMMEAGLALRIRKLHEKFRKAEL